MADAVAMTKRDWGHFQGRKGSMPADGSRQWLPHELAAELQRRRLRPPMGSAQHLRAAVASSGSLSRSSGSSEQPVPDIEPLATPLPMAQRARALGEVCGLARARGVQLLPSASGGPKTVAEFLHYPVAAGSCVITRPAPKSPVGKASSRLQMLPFWVWRVLSVFDVGAELPQNSMHLDKATQPTYEAQLYCPKSGAVRGVNAMGGPMEPCWDERHVTTFLRTPDEKAARKLNKLKWSKQGKRSRRPTTDLPTKKVLFPLRALLRPGNLAGGGFMLTASGRVPEKIRRHCLEALQTPAANLQE